jgi:hypothetical protein
VEEDVILPPAVLWVDPGQMTGLAALVDGGTRFWAYEYGFMETGSAIERMCQHYRGNLWIGWEAFRIHPKTPPADAHHAIEMIGVTRRAATTWCCRQMTPAGQPAGDRNVATMAMLKQLGWWVPGQDDAQSAAQHMLAWLMRTNSMPPNVAAVVSEAARSI